MIWPLSILFGEREGAEVNDAMHPIVGEAYLNSTDVKERINPFRDNWTWCRVMEIKNGWVRYGYLNEDGRYCTNATSTTEASNFHETNENRRWYHLADVEERLAQEMSDA